MSKYLQIRNCVNAWILQDEYYKRNQTIKYEPKIPFYVDLSKSPISVTDYQLYGNLSFDQELKNMNTDYFFFNLF